MQNLREALRRLAGVLLVVVLAGLAWQAPAAAGKSNERCIAALLDSTQTLVGQPSGLAKLAARKAETPLPLCLLPSGDEHGGQPSLRPTSAASADPEKAHTLGLSGSSTGRAPPRLI